MRSLVPLLLALAPPSAALAAGEGGQVPEAPASRALSPVELRGDVGVLSSGLAGEGSAWADTFAAQALSGHVLLGGLTLEGGLLSLLPVSPGGAGASLTLTARVGYTGERWSLVAGPVLGLGYTARPRLQVLPSLRLLRHVGPVTLHAGLLDLHGLVPAHLGVSWKDVGLAYIAPLGARAWARLPLSSDLALRVEGFAFRLAGTQSAWLTLGMDVSP
ncbi:hypothetical protein [Melittangium boletus]|uniref:Lipoprotein n=1 Tax=Melittangium boletus DSM 14713 TaxID=1294270 RepID=A0A250IDD8_9BACT|nr:hypothetical protein [Melittangium boletus]ATB29228.1 hypothetical protein MEBOL_002677 [Melittangium boletus DSM 14713]